jgi:hypothetical protein
VLARARERVQLIRHWLRNRNAEQQKAEMAYRMRNSDREH